MGNAAPATDTAGQGNCGMGQEDRFDLQRFVRAQEPVIGAVLGELREARKRTHWMWFVFPQHRGLGRSYNAQFYGIGSMDEARAYLTHPMLGARLEECTRLVLESGGTSLNAIFGSPDDMKFCSSMTLFVLASGEPDSVFAKAIARWCDGRQDERTVALLRQDN
jgi:uncharacterized protein (DUF1810 family)